MVEETLKTNIRAIQALYPIAEELPYLLNTENLKGFPLWMKKAITVYELPFLGAPSAPLYLVAPASEITFDQLSRIYKQLTQLLQRHVLVIADRLPSKYRPMLVRLRIPFIYKDEFIFAPELGVNGKIKSLDYAPNMETTNAALSPFALKIVAGLLTKFIPFRFTLKALHEQITENKQFKLSPSKLSLILSDLARKNILISHGAGPTKFYSVESAKDIWERIQTTSIDPLFRIVKTNYAPQDIKKYCLAGGSALAHYSNLATPKEITIAMTANVFRTQYQNSFKKNNLQGDFENTVSLQTWKEDPFLFSIDGVINPIELYFSIRHNPDERIQMSLDEMLAKFQLERKED